jgi:phthiocerol/phenolphthiocerol synthesis type-I polyketide synthase E
VSVDPTGTGTVAVVGMACRFPGARDVRTFWENLAGGVDSVTRFPAETTPDGASFRPACGLLEGAEEFDAAFFGYAPLEALITDPQQRVFLECAWEALEDTGLDPLACPGAVGVYAGATVTPYAESLRGLAGAHPYQVQLGTAREFLSTRVAYKLGLTGPALTVQTGCSTSLVAIHLAAQALATGDCDLALAGGVCVYVPAQLGHYAEGGVFAADGYCRAFDAAADGMVGGDGVGVVVLERLADALANGHHVRAVLRGSAVNNDGTEKVGYTAPSVGGQARAIRTAHLVAGVDPSTVGYVETHGTGTPLGDPIEIAALTRAFRAGGVHEPEAVWIGSVKTNIGHTDAAAGVAGFIKTVLALEHRQIPPTLHFREPNPQLGLASSPFRVCTDLVDWKGTPEPLRAGVSAFGIGGTNAHLVVEEAPRRDRLTATRPWHLLVVSARTPAALEATAARLAGHVELDSDLVPADVAWTLQAGRHAFAHRRFAVCGDAGDMAAALSGDEPGRLVSGTAPAGQQGGPPVVFMFPGQGAQRVGMAADLYQHEPVFRQQLRECAELAAPTLGVDLTRLLYPDPGETAAAAERLGRIAYGQPAVFAVEYALAQMWLGWGVQPAAVVGHSLGAYAAACVAGVFPLADAVELVVARGRLLQGLPAGAMLAVPLPPAEVEPFLDTNLNVAAVNRPDQCAVSGPVEAIDALAGRFAAAGVDARRLRIATAGHSTLVEPVLEEFADLVGRVRLREPDLPVVSDTLGTWLEPELATDPRYWSAHLRRTVNFSAAIGTLAGEPGCAFLEVGPGITLAGLARQHPELTPDRVVTATLPHPSDPGSALASALTAAGRLWLAGVPLDWVQLNGGSPGRRTPLPTTAFQHRRYAPAPVPAGAPAPAERTWTAPPPDEDSSGGTVAVARAPQGRTESAVAALFGEVLGLAGLGRDANFFELGGDSLIAAQLITRARTAFARDLPVRSIFLAPTVAGLAQLIEQHQTSADGGTHVRG